MEQLYLARLKVPHIGKDSANPAAGLFPNAHDPASSDIAETFSAYSTFVSTFDNDNYSKSLPAANKIYSPTAAKADERYPEEEKLASLPRPPVVTAQSRPDCSFPTRRKPPDARLRPTWTTSHGNGRSNVPIPRSSSSSLSAPSGTTRKILIFGRATSSSS